VLEEHRRAKENKILKDRRNCSICPRALKHFIQEDKLEKELKQVFELREKLENEV
jgi:hypothetical protein